VKAPEDEGGDSQEIPRRDPRDFDIAGSSAEDRIPGLWVLLAVAVYGIAFFSPILVQVVVLVLGGDSVVAAGAATPIVGVLLASGSVWAVRKLGGSAADIGWRRSDNLLRDVLLAVAVAVAITAVAEGWDRLLSLLGAQADFLEPFRAFLASPFLVVMLAVGAVVTAPIGEELFFRGYILTLMSARTARWVSILLVALLFAVTHFSTVPAWPPLFAFGVMLGWLRLRTGSLVAPITAHLLNNLISVTLLILHRV